MKSVKTRSFFLLIFIVGITSLFSDCNKEKNVYNITARFIRKTNPAGSSQTVTLSFNDTASTTFAVRSENIGIHVSDIDVTGTKLSGSSVPPLTAWVSMTYVRTNNDLLTSGNGFAGNVDWLSKHVGELAVCTDVLWLDHAPNEFGYRNTDSTVNIAQVDDLGASLHPVYRETGASYLVKLTDQDQFIPFVHPDVPTGRAITLADVTSNKMHLDMSSLTGSIFTTLSGTLTASVAALPTFNWTLPGGINVPLVKASLGGPNRDGDFKLHFIPQLQSNESGVLGDTANQIMRSPGIGFYFEGTINIKDAVTGLINAGNIKVVIPMFLTFQRTDNTGDFQVELQPFADLSRGLGKGSTALDKIIILATTPFGIQSKESAGMIRESIKAGLTGLATSPGGLGVFISSTIAFSSGVNKYKKNRDLAKVEFDVITVPNLCGTGQSPLCFTYNGLIPTQVQPQGPGSTKISAFILNKYR